MSQARAAVENPDWQEPEIGFPPMPEAGGLTPAESARMDEEVPQPAGERFVRDMAKGFVKAAVLHTIECAADAVAPGAGRLVSLVWHAGELVEIATSVRAGDGVDVKVPLVVQDDVGFVLGVRVTVLQEHSHDGPPIHLVGDLDPFEPPPHQPTLAAPLSEPHRPDTTVEAPGPYGVRDHTEPEDPVRSVTVVVPRAEIRAATGSTVVDAAAVARYAEPRVPAAQPQTDRSRTTTVISYLDPDTGVGMTTLAYAEGRPYAPLLFEISAEASDSDLIRLWTVDVDMPTASAAETESVTAGPTHSPEHVPELAEVTSVPGDFVTGSTGTSASGASTGSETGNLGRADEPSQTLAEDWPDMLAELVDRFGGPADLLVRTALVVSAVTPAVGRGLASLGRAPAPALYDYGAYATAYLVQAVASLRGTSTDPLTVRYALQDVVRWALSGESDAARSGRSQVVYLLSDKRLLRALLAGADRDAALDEGSKIRRTITPANDSDVETDHNEADADGDPLEYVHEQLEALAIHSEAVDRALTSLFADLHHRAGR
jgi:hypothetical protein